MEDLETHKARRIEQMVAKWLRRSRDNSARGRASVSDGSSDGSRQPASHVKLTVEVQKDLLLGHYGFEVSHHLPLLVTSVVAGSTAEGKILPGDQILAINNAAAEGITGEQAASLLRESQDSLQFTVLRCTSGGHKSSFLTAEKRARLKTNPVKVRFAEEVVVNGPTQGSSLLCMPNVLKVYLENGQTKAFKFEANTTVKDIVLTLKEKLSLQSIEHFALVLEEQYNVLKMHLLHEDELIDQVVQRKESHNYRCLFRVCFIPRDPLNLLQQDPVAFEYLYLQSCSDVLQERFAVEMKCSVALRLAALHIQERIITCAQPQKVSLKYIEKDWGIENFISPTLLRNMRGKDIKKAISFHMKRNQLLLDPRQKHLLSAAQVRLCYLQILGDLKLYGGKIFNATLMLQDRESCIALLVGAKYGISQVVNNKLNIITVLAEFANISRLELTEESDKVSMVKIYLQDIQMLTVLLESNSAKDLACLISGYYRMFVDSSSSIFIWGKRKPQMHRFSAEEGYESRICSDSEESSEPESSLDHFSDVQSPKYSTIGPLIEEEDEQQGLEQDRKTLWAKETTVCNGYNPNDSLSEASDSANTESRGLKSSGSSDSLDALEEDDLETCSASRPEVFQFCTPDLQQLAGNDKLLFGTDGEEESQTTQENFFSFLLPPHIPSPGLSQPEAESKRESDTGALESRLAEGNVMEYYSLCANISPASSGGRNTLNDSSESCSLQDAEDQERVGESQVHAFALQHSLSSENTNSDDEFYDAAERMTTIGPGDLSLNSSPELPSCDSLGENILSRQSRKTKHRATNEPKCDKSMRKRRSFLQTNYTSQVTFPIASPHALKNNGHVFCSRESAISGASCSPAVTSLREPQQVPHLLEAKQQIQMAKNPASSIGSEGISSVAQGSSEATTENHEKKTLNHKVSITNTGPLPGVSYVLIEEIIHTTTKPSWSESSIQNKLSSSTALLDQDPLPAEMVEEQEQHVLGPCRRLKDDPIQCKSSQALEGFMFEESISHMTDKETTQKSEEEKHLISNGTELFFSCDDDLRLETHVSYHDYGSVVEYEEMSQQTDKKFQNVLDVNNFTLKDGVLSPVLPNLSAMATSQNLCLSKDLAGDNKTEVKNLTGDTHKDKMPSSSKSSTKDNLEHSKADDSDGLGYISSDILCQAGKFSVKNSVSKQSILSSDNAAGDMMAFNNTGPPALVNSQGISSPRQKLERCSCHFPYASCFHELDDEAEPDCIPPIASSISEGPLTSPPSTRNLLPLNLNPTRHLLEHNCTNGIPKDSQQCTHLPESPLKALSNMKEKMSALPFDFCRLLGNVVELQEILRQFRGNQIKHPQDKCSAHSLGSKNALHVKSQRLLSNCQKVIRSHGPCPETLMLIQETFRNLLQLTEACFQFTNCGLCKSRHTELKSNLKDVLCRYQQFVQASRQAYEKGYSSLSIKLLVCQYTALTAALLCLVQLYKASSCT